MALVLMVVDEPDTLLSLSRALEAAGHRVVLAADADTAAQRLATRPVDAIVVDVTMPVRDGWAVLDGLGALAQAPPVLAISGRAGPLDRARATRLGAAGWLDGPFTPDDLNRALTALLAARAGRPRLG